MRGRGSPKAPLTVELEAEPRERHASHNRQSRGRAGARESCLILASPPQRFRPLPERVPSPSALCFHPHDFTKSRKKVTPPGTFELPKEQRRSQVGEEMQPKPSRCS